MFDRFYRGANCRGRQGSGLGLAIVRQVAQQHGGSVGVANAPDGGAIFTMRLPCSAPPTRKSTLPPTWSSKPGRPTRRCGAVSALGALAAGRSEPDAPPGSAGAAARSHQVDRYHSEQHDDGVTGLDDPDQRSRRSRPPETRRASSCASGSRRSALAAVNSSTPSAHTIDADHGHYGASLLTSPTTKPMPPARIAISETGTPPNALGGGSPNVFSELTPRAWWDRIACRAEPGGRGAARRAHAECSAGCAACGSGASISTEPQCWPG